MKNAIYETVPGVVYDEESGRYIFNQDVLRSADYILANDSYEACAILNIPVNILGDIPTGDLLEIALETPVSSDVIFFQGEEWAEAIDIIRSKSNAVDELLKREDAPQLLLKKYTAVSVDNEYEAWCKFFALEALVVYPGIVKQFDGDEINLLQEIVVLKADSKADMEGYLCRTNTALDALAAQGIGENLSRGQNVTKYTPNHSAVYGYEYYSSDADLTATEKAAELAKVQNQSGVISYVANSATNRYNCHYFAWFRRYANYSSEKCRILEPQPFISDGSTSSNTTPALNRIVVYPRYSSTNNNHSGFICSYTNSSNYYVRSKWGVGYIVTHTKTGCPYYYSTYGVRYYNDMSPWY
ncbi:MAG: hypothetical protein IJ744_05985 [Lachnospiraceae bacterium]|nr:hypothetical protein [Lachnospiraceae bacterium]